MYCKCASIYGFSFKFRANSFEISVPCIPWMTLLRTHCCSWCFLGVQTRGTQNQCCVSMLRKLGNIYCGHKIFLNRIRNIFASRTQIVRSQETSWATMCPQQSHSRSQNLCPQQMLRARANGKHLGRQQCVPSNKSSFGKALILTPKMAMVYIFRQAKS